MNRLLLVSITLMGISASAASYYVKTNGSDSADGLALGSAWVTIQKAANTVIAGDIVRVQPGVYAERVAESTDGSAGSRITYVADGAVTVCGWNITGNYVQVINFDITPEPCAGIQTYAGIVFNGATGGLAADNTIHDTEDYIGYGVEIILSNDVTIRGNYVHHLWGIITNAGAFLVRSAPSYNIVFEYNRSEYVGDHYVIGCTNTVIRNALMGPIYSETESHVDGVQQNGSSPLGLFEFGWSRDHVDLSSVGRHVYLNQTEESDYWIVRGHVSNAHPGGLDLQRADFTAIYHNTWVSNFAYWVTSFQVYAHTDSTGNLARKNIYYRSADPSLGYIYTTNFGGEIDKDWDVSYQSGDPSETNDVIADPLFLGLQDFHLEADSPARDLAGSITTANGAGTNSTTLVLNHWAFWPGDRIYIGATLVTVATVNESTLTLTITPAATWSNGDGVSWASPSGVKIDDAGAFESALDTVMSTPEYVKSGSTYYMATIPFEWRMVVYYVDGVPQSPIMNPSNSTFNESGNVTVIRVYPWFASETLWIDASISLSSMARLSGRVTLSGNVIIR